MTAAGSLDWAVFFGLVAAALLADVIVARLGGKTPKVRNAALWSGVWIGLGVAFAGWVAVRMGTDASISYLTAYLLEKSLSVDNLFLFVLIFAQTGVPAALQPRALFWGIVGALVMRALLIGAGVYLLARFHWIIYPFAALLVFAAVRMLWGKEEEQKLVTASCALCTSWVGRIIPIQPFTRGTGFFVRDGGRLMATPLLVALVVIETTDIVFALDSIPAVFAVTRDPFLVYTSNIFALLGLRSLYFVLAGAIRDLRFLRTGLGVMLLFVAAKMLAGEALPISPLGSLLVIAAIFTVAIVASRLYPRRPDDAVAAPPFVSACTHRDQMRDVSQQAAECQLCVASGDAWIGLRMCMTCGEVGCCDNSKNRHASRHFADTGHPIVRSVTPGEAWKWCYIDRTRVE